MNAEIKVRKAYKLILKIFEKYDKDNDITIRFIFGKNIPTENGDRSLTQYPITVFAKMIIATFQKGTLKAKPNDLKR